ncbi:MAG TPA: nicotinate phosphoribosyltransferase [bacterium]|nr:nicotinate phosphoribosyltransferase [bacterium]
MIIDPARSPLLTDLYQFTMLQVYHAAGMTDGAVFELHFRRFAGDRAFLMAAGSESVLEWLEQLAFSPEECAWLNSTGRFSSEFIASLADFRFTGDVDAMPEGTIFFAEEPVLRITAPLREAQLIESRVLNLIHLQTLVAAKAARCVLAAGGRLPLVDFGLRRAYGAEAGMLAARAAYVAGFAGTATVLAGERFGIPLFGTMAHSYIEAHPDEEEAFVRFGRVHPHNTTLLIDTYDIVRGAERAARAALRLAAEGIRVQAVRIDSGNCAAVARQVRAVLDRNGCRDVRIMATGNLDEYALAGLLAADVPVDACGIGTRLVIPSAPPDPDCAYKLVAYAGRPRLKCSAGKATWPGAKQVWREYRDGMMVADTIGLAEEKLPGRPLLVPMLRNGKRVAVPEPLAAARTRAAAECAALPAELRRLDGGDSAPFPVERTPAVVQLRSATEREFR